MDHTTPSSGRPGGETHRVHVAAVGAGVLACCLVVAAVAGTLAAVALAVIAAAAYLLGVARSGDHRAAPRVDTSGECEIALRWRQTRTDPASIVLESGAERALGRRVAEWNQPGVFWRSLSTDDQRLLSAHLQPDGRGTSWSPPTIDLHLIDDAGTEHRVRLCVDEHADSDVVQGLLIDLTGESNDLRQHADLVELADLNPIGTLVAGPDPRDATGASIATWRLRYLSDAASAALQLSPTALLSPGSAPQLGDAIGHDTARRIESVIEAAAATSSPAMVEGVTLVQQPHRHYNLRARQLADGAIGIVIEDVTEVLLSTQRLRRLALHDPLTGLPNRTLLRHHLDASLNASSAICLAVLDIDDFGEVNDVLGCEAGDELLIAAATALRGALPEALAIARIGDDEFAVVADERSCDDADGLARTIVGAFEAPLDLGTFPVRVRPTIGLAATSSHAYTAAGLVSAASVAMRSAKSTGQRHVVWTPELAVSSPRRLAMLAELESAIEGDKLELWFQPAIDFRSRQVTKVEALARWRHPQHGLVEPAEFIRLAEASGLIEPLTRWMLSRVGELASAETNTPNPLKIAANLSMLDIHNEATIDFLVSMATHGDIDPSLIELEITESEIMGDPDVARAALVRLAAAGFPLTVDDFGTGYSSLKYLQDLPVSGVKLDRNFVSAIELAPASSEIVRTTITLAHRLQLEVTAEGVASSAAFAQLHGWGCDLAQGFWLSPPVPAAQLGPQIQQINARAQAILPHPTVDLREPPPNEPVYPAPRPSDSSAVSNAQP